MEIGPRREGGRPTTTRLAPQSSGSVVEGNPAPPCLERLLLDEVLARTVIWERLLLDELQQTDIVLQSTVATRNGFMERTHKLVREAATHKTEINRHTAQATLLAEENAWLRSTMHADRMAASAAARLYTKTRAEENERAKIQRTHLDTCRRALNMLGVFLLSGGRLRVGMNPGWLQIEVLGKVSKEPLVHALDRLSLMVPDEEGNVSALSVTTYDLGGPCPLEDLSTVGGNEAVDQVAPGPNYANDIVWELARERTAEREEARLDATNSRAKLAELAKSFAALDRDSCLLLNSLRSEAMGRKQDLKLMESKLCNATDEVARLETRAKVQETEMRWLRTKALAYEHDRDEMIRMTESEWTSSSVTRGPYKQRCETLEKKLRSTEKGYRKTVAHRDATINRLGAEREAEARANVDLRSELSKAASKAAGLEVLAEERWSMRVDGIAKARDEALLARDEALRKRDEALRKRDEAYNLSSYLRETATDVARESRDRIDELQREREEALSIREVSSTIACVVCMESEAPLTLSFPCGHVACCTTCAPKNKLCVICRATVAGSIPAYVTGRVGG